MRPLLGCLSVLLCLTAARADSTSDLIARLDRAAAASTLYASTLKPWHLKVAFTLYDEKGTNPVNGVMEEWWAGPDQDRTTYTSPNLSGTMLQTPEGKFQTPEMGSESRSLEALHMAIVDPMPSTSRIDKSRPDLDQMPAGKIKLDCISLPPKMAHPGHPPLGLFPTFCFAPGTDALRSTFSFGGESMARNGMGHFQGQSVSTQVKLAYGKATLGEAKVITLETLASSAIDLNTTGLEKASEAYKVPGSVVAARLLQKTYPRYPESAKQAHISGNVLLHAIIGKDGHVRQLTVLTTPDSDLAIAAITAVRDWVYQPYLVNGEPTEVDTTITVQFTFS